MSGPDEQTPIVCLACKARFTIGQGSGELRCPSCGRSLSPAQTDASRRRSSKTFPGLEKACRELSIRLRARATADTNRLADKMDAMVTELRKLQVEPPTGDKSVEIHKTVLDLVRLGEEMLSGKVLPR